MDIDREQMITQTMDDFYNLVKSVDPVDAPDRLERLAAQQDKGIAIAAFSRLVALMNARLKFAGKKPC